MLRKHLTRSLPLIVVLLAGPGSGASGQSTFNGKTQLDLACPDKNKPPCTQAKAMIESAAVLVMGEQVPAGSWETFANRMMDYGIVPAEKSRQGIDLNDALGYFKHYVTVESPAQSYKLIDRAFLEVFGTLPVIAERDGWLEKVKARQAWYITIAGAEKGRLNGDAALRKKVIDRVYKAAMGRPADDTNYQHWLPRPEHYAQMLEASRKWLHSPAGEKDLRGAVRVALYPKLKREPTPGEIDKGVEQVRPGRLIYREMLPVLQQ